jgi:glycosyltransferase involved in cell wall biosynthesis
MTISVIIPTYNHAHFLPECLKAVFDQEMLPLEVIVVDDASSDNTAEVIASFQRRHPELIYLRNSENLGPARSINKALSLAKGEYIVGSAADDFVLPGFFQKGAEFLNKHPTLALCCGDTFHFHDQKPYQFQFLKTLNLESTTVFDPLAVQQLFRTKRFAIQSHACMYRKSYMLEVGGFIRELQSLCDWYLNVCLALKWGFGYIPHSFAAYRLSTGSYANAVSKNVVARREVLDCLFGLLENPENRSLKQTFKKCRMFSQLGYRYFFDFIKRPRYWNLTLFSFPLKLRNLLASRWSSFRNLRISLPKR